MAFGGGHSNRGAKNGSATWLSASGNQWNLSSQNRREAENDEWNQTGQNISNNLEWQPQKTIPANKNKNKRKSNARKNARRVLQAEDNEDGCELAEENPTTNFPRTKFTASAVSVQNGLNGARQKVHTFEDESTGEGDRNESTRSQKRTWRDEATTTIKNISKNVEYAGNDQTNVILSQLPNANVIIERLKQIRDYMKQVAYMIDTLHKSGDHRVIERMNKLQKVYSDLQCSEKQLIDLLNKISMDKKKLQIIKFSKLMNDLESQESECLNVIHHFVDLHSDHDRPAEEKSASSAANSDDEEDFDSGEQYKSPQLLQSVIENGSKGLDSVQLAKRNELLKKVAESQEKLKTLQDQQAALISLQRKAENRLAQAKSLSSQSTNTQLEEVTPVEIEAAASHLLQDEMEGLQDRLNALKDLYDNRQRAESMSRSVDTDDRSEEPEVLTEMQRQELQVKLQDLQEKKNYMDSLLQELKSLPTARIHEMNNSENFSEKIKDGASASSVAKQTLDNAQEILASLDLTEKFGNLKDMKQRLRYLHDLVAQFPAEAADVDDNLNSSFNQNQTLARTSSAEQLSAHKKQNEKKIIKPRKRDNLNLNDMNCDVIDNVEKEESDDNSVNVGTVDENETQRHLLRLQKAKDKLCRLQDLLSSVNDPHHISDNKPGIVQHLLENLDIVEDGGFVAQGTSNEHFVENTGEENVRKERKRRSGFIAFQTQGQPASIDHLIEESHRLLENQEQFNLTQKHTNNFDMMPAPATNRSYEQPRLVAGRSETKVPPAKHNETKISARLKQGNQNSIHKVGEKRISLDVESGNGELMTSNHEIWSEVRQRFILREELRQKKRELEELMKKDKGKTNSRNQDNMSDNVSYSNKSETLGLSYVGTEGTTVATWGGSTQGNLDEDQEEQNESQEEIENEIEEEIEEEFSVEDRTAAANVASGRNDIRFAQPKVTRTDATDLNAGADKPTGTKSAIAQKTKSECKADGKKSWEKIPLTRDTVHNWNNHSNLRQTERQNAPESDESFQPPMGTRTEMTNAMWQQQAMQFMQQLEQTNILHHSILRDQSHLANLLQQMSISTAPPQSDSFHVQFPEMIQHLTSQLQHQQQLVNLHQCHHLMYLQQMEIQQLQRQLHQLLNVGMCAQNITSEEATTQCSNANAEQAEFHPLVPPTWFASNHMVPLTSAQMTNAISSSGSNLFPTNFLNPDQLSPGSQTLNNQVAPGIRTNNYWDNFRSYSRQNLLSAASGNKSGSGNVMLNPRTGTLMQNRHILAPQPTVADSSFRPGVSTSLHGHVMVDTPTLQRMGSTGGVPKLDLDRLATKSKSKKDKVNQNNHQATDAKSASRYSHTSGASAHEHAATNEAAKAGMSGSIADVTGASSASAVPFDSFVRQGMATYFANNRDQRSINAESDDMNDRSLFDSLWTSIYGEVAVLLSRNENRPHFLIQIFKELQKLNSDYLRQNALSLLSDLISRLNLENDANFPKMHSCGRRQLDQMWADQTANTTSELAANESGATSDEDEFRMSRPPPKELSSVSKSHSQTIHGQHFDYAELAESGATVSSPSTSVEQPLTSSVAETLIQVNKAKEVNQQKQKSFPLSTSHSSPLPSTMCQSLSEDAMSFAQDGVSEMSSSEIPQVDDQIQGIMLEVIPFLKTHLNDICSPRLLLSLQQLIIFLVTERNEAMELSQLFRKRLTSALQVTLAKYTGNRLRDCGEPLLVDTSEVLFSELAFVHLVQNVDSVNNTRGKMRTFQTFTETFSTLGNVNEGSPRKEDPFVNGVRKLPTSVGADVEATDADECLVSKMEEDELGQSRDDSMAANCDIFDNENGSRPSSINSFKESNSHNEHDSSCRTREFSPAESASPNGACASAAVMDLSNLRQDQDSILEQTSMGEIDNETEEGLEDNLDLAEADQPQNLLDRSAHPASESEYENLPRASEQATGVEATEDDQLRGERGGIHDCAQGEAMPVAEGGFEQGLDEIPIKLLPLLQREISARRSEEESLNNLVDEILNDSVEAELAENFLLRQPDSQ